MRSQKVHGLVAYWKQNSPAEIESIIKEDDPHGNCNGNWQWLKHYSVDGALQVQYPCVDNIVQERTKHSLNKESFKPH